MTNQEKARELAKKAPALREQDRKALNRLFTAYIFRSGNKIWTSCCNRHKVLDWEKCSDAERDVLITPHVPEPTYHWYKCTNEMASSVRVWCPYCGAEAKLKESRYSGKRKNLWEYRRGVVLRQWRGSLWALAYDLSKSYEGQFLGEPNYRPCVQTNLLGVYRFRPGRCESGTKRWWVTGDFEAYQCMTEFDLKKPGGLCAPYGYCSDLGKSYEIIGLEELKKSEFKYCGFEKLYKQMDDPLELLTLCCFEPRKVEMLIKAGVGWAVKNLIDNHVKNAKILNWYAKEPKDFLKVPMRKLREMGAGDEKRVRLWEKLGMPPAEEMDAAEEINTSSSAEKLFKNCKRLKIGYRKLVEYLKREDVSIRPVPVFSTTAQIWCDYIDAAEGVGLDLCNPLVVLPRNLNEKHDMTCGAWAAMQDTKNQEMYRKRCNKLKKKYEFSYDGLCIVIPSGGEAIKLEGKTLHHCVGGYAQRHMDGVTTILFLRRAEHPEKPMVTIEMSGNNIKQIHGWDDERTACPENPGRTPCMELYAEFLTVWLDWLKAGSKRDKKGNPIIPKKYLQQEVKTA